MREHVNYQWDDFASGISELNDNLRTSPDVEGTAFSLDAHLLERVTQITLALHQVAENTLLYEVPRRVNKYCLDPDWQLLLLMEDNCDPRRIVAAFKSRLTEASRRVKRLFSSLQRLSFLAT